MTLLKQQATRNLEYPLHNRIYVVINTKLIILFIDLFILHQPIKWKLF